MPARDFPCALQKGLDLVARSRNVCRQNKSEALDSIIVREFDGNYFARWKIYSGFSHEILLFNQEDCLDFLSLAQQEKGKIGG
jgi:hypothetical protein